MGIPFDMEAIEAAFAQPACDGSFAPDFAAYLNELGQTRPSVVLAFAPKAAGTYLRSAAVLATGGVLVRTVHAQGGRDAAFYLPAFLNYFAHGFPARTLITHAHMQALPANRHFIEALDLRPVIMLRAIPDMLASYWDMLDGDHLSPDNWINLQVPPHFAAMRDAEKGDFLIRMVAPWYVSYFATWLEYAAAAPGRVLVLDYDAFRRDPVDTLERILRHSRVPGPRAKCEEALAAVWEDRLSFRFNRGVAGRGRARFTPMQIADLERQVAFYPGLASVAARLIPPP
ncbi:MAG TPA: sulfotransferase domain-containing protein [Rhizomicrobium sp.]|nr:sulfotransferase domain-containing protein [Rhizomicrobium sp.]